MKIIQSSVFLSSLVSEVSSGSMMPAAMQRPYVWHKADVEALCDSILSGFPVGSFLTWAPGNCADLSNLSRGRLGPIVGLVNSHPSTQLLLDGQNRLASLAWMMNQDLPEMDDASEAERATWLSGERLVLDFETRSIKFVPEAEANLNFRLPVWSVFNTMMTPAMSLLRLRTKQWMESYSEEASDAVIDFWNDCRSRFQDARTTLTIIDGATPEEARHAFLRISRVGVPMSQEDFDYALGWKA
ncbi:DUF262 domain-containing protein [Pseudomonas luteola]